MAWLNWRHELCSSDAQPPAAYRSLMPPTSAISSHSGDSPSVSGICARVIERAEKAKVERRKAASIDKSRDQDRGKGAMEQDSNNEGGNTSMQGQLGHRDENAELKNADSDLSG